MKYKGVYVMKKWEYGMKLLSWYGYNPTKYKFIKANHESYTFEDKDGKLLVLRYQEEWLK